MYSIFIKQCEIRTMHQITFVKAWSGFEKYYASHSKKLCKNNKAKTARFAMAYNVCLCMRIIREEIKYEA